MLDAWLFWFLNVLYFQWLPNKKTVYFVLKYFIFFIVYLVFEAHVD